jgi:hypothetical protein
LGSGAIESSIRRVVNLRLKGNSIYWREENAEAMLQIRAQVLTNRWDERLAALRQLQSHDGRTDWASTTGRDPILPTRFSLWRCELGHLGLVSSA